MLELERRTAKLEGRVEGQGHVLTDVAAAVRHLEMGVDRRFADVDMRFTAIDARLTALDQKLDHRCEALTQRMDALEAAVNQKLDSHFRWIVGLQIGMVLTVVTLFIAR